MVGVYCLPEVMSKLRLHPKSPPNCGGLFGYDNIGRVELTNKHRLKKLNSAQFGSFLRVLIEAFILRIFTLTSTNALELMACSM